MGLTPGASAALSLAVSLIIGGGIRFFKTILSSNQLLTVVGGYLGSLVFIFLLTAVSNIQMHLFGKQYQTKLFEVILSLLLACLVSSLVHRVSITTCILFSFMALYFLNKISNRVHQAAPPVATLASAKKKR
ncbi:Protein KRTCAP2 -like protein [Halotydeus destructor]|nr:Protein KRTCAP2 -like protein [Halotydeus destructor]